MPQDFKFLDQVWEWRDGKEEHRQVHLSIKETGSLIISIKIHAHDKFYFGVETSNRSR